MLPAGSSIFLDFRVPNATTWFYLSLVLAIALCFRFNRLLSLRNWDLLGLFLLVPGLLLLREGQELRQEEQGRLAAQAALALAASMDTVAVVGPLAPAPAASAVTVALELHDVCTVSSEALEAAQHRVWIAYLYLLIGSAVFLARCLIDLGINRRPVFIPNLNTAGLAWIGATLFVVLSVRSLFPPPEPVPEAKNQSVVLEKAADAAAHAAEQVNLTVAPQQYVRPATWVRTVIALTCHLAAVVGLFLIGTYHFHNTSAGVAAAVLYLLLPYTAYHVKDIHHAFPAALLVAAIACYRWPTIAGLLMGIAAAMVYFPLLLFPVWFGFYRRAGAGRFSAAFACVLLALAVYLFLDRSVHPELYAALSLPDWRAWDLSARPTGEGLWTGVEVHYAYRAPLFIAYLALVVASAFWPSPKNLAHLIALSAALILGVQFWYADAGGIYVLWYLPLLLLVYVRPNLSERFAPRIDPRSDWVTRLRQALRPPRPPAEATPPEPVAARH
jgi:hypothetical protein